MRNLKQYKYMHHDIPQSQKRTVEYSNINIFENLIFHSFMTAANTKICFYIIKFSILDLDRGMFLSLQNIFSCKIICFGDNIIFMVIQKNGYINMNYIKIKLI